MSDNFLDKFSNKNYSSTSQPENTKKENHSTDIEETSEIEVSVDDVKPKKDVSSKIEESTNNIKPAPKHAAKENIVSKPEVTSRHVEHDVDIDYEYQKKRKQKKLIIIISSVVVTAIVITSVIMMNLVTIMDTVGKNIGEVKNWAKSNNITLEIDYSYTTKYDENLVISQETDPGKKVFKGKTLNIKVSKGADPEEKIEIPDINTMSLDDINQWVETNKLSNVKITKQFSEEIEKNKVLEHKFEDGVSAETYKRKNQLQIIVSKGKETFEKNIEVKDFTNLSKAEVEAWGKTNEVTIAFEEAASATVMKDMVISQSVAVGEKVSKEDTITVVISYGKSILVPNFGSVYKDDAATDYIDLAVIVKEQYHGTVGYGGLISQSVPAGSYVREENNNVTVVYSLGKPYVDDLTQMTEKDLAEYFYNFKAKGANITYTVEYISGDFELKGTIAYASKRSEFVSMNENIHIQIYR